MGQLLAMLSTPQNKTHINRRKLAEKGYFVLSSRVPPPIPGVSHRWRLHVRSASLLMASFPVHPYPGIRNGDQPSDLTPTFAFQRSLLFFLSYLTTAPPPWLHSLLGLCGRKPFRVNGNPSWPEPLLINNNNKKPYNQRETANYCLSTHLFNLLKV